MVQGAKHMKSKNAAANGGSSPQPKPQPKPKRRRKRLPRWADRLITIVIILIGVGLMTWPWILDRLEASGVFNQISTVSSTVDALSAEDRMVLEVTRSIREDYLQQNAFDEVDTYTSLAKQYQMLKLVLAYGRRGAEALDAGAELSAVLSLPVRDRIARMKYIPEKQIDQLAEIETELNSQIAALADEGGR